MLFLLHRRIYLETNETTSKVKRNPLRGTGSIQPSGHEISLNVAGSFVSGIYPKNGFGAVSSVVVLGSLPKATEETRTTTVNDDIVTGFFLFCNCCSELNGSRSEIVF